MGSGGGSETTYVPKEWYAPDVGGIRKSIVDWMSKQPIFQQSGDWGTIRNMYQGVLQNATPGVNPQLGNILSQMVSTGNPFTLSKSGGGGGMSNPRTQPRFGQPAAGGNMFNIPQAAPSLSLSQFPESTFDPQKLASLTPPQVNPAWTQWNDFVSNYPAGREAGMVVYGPGPEQFLPSQAAPTTQPTANLHLGPDKGQVPAPAGGGRRTGGVFGSVANMLSNAGLAPAGDLGYQSQTFADLYNTGKPLYEGELERALAQARETGGMTGGRGSASDYYMGKAASDTTGDFMKWLIGSTQQAHEAAQARKLASLPYAFGAETFPYQELQQLMGLSGGMATGGMPWLDLAMRMANIGGPGQSADVIVEQGSDPFSSIAGLLGGAGQGMGGLAALLPLL